MTDHIRPASRACQLESLILDRELNKILDESVDALEIPIASEEFKLLTKIYLCGNLIKNFTTIGMNIFHTSFFDVQAYSKDQISDIRPHKLKLATLTALNLITPYVLKKCNGSLPGQALIDKLNYPLLNAENLQMCYKFLNVINFLAFLRDGKYLLLQQRLLGVVPGVSDKYYSKNMSRHLMQMELIDRQAVWTGVSEFLTGVAPLINYTSLKDRALRLSNWFQRTRSSSRPLSDEYSRKLYHQCTICEKQPFNPYTIGCRHVFCYYCLLSRFPTNPDAKYSCPACNYEVAKNQVQSLKIYELTE